MNSLDQEVIEDLKKWKLVNVNVIKYYWVTKGVNYNETWIELTSELTADMLRDGTWQKLNFKKMNTKSKGLTPDGGHLHPLLKTWALFREKLIELGFEEMPTSRFVESCFWNFDSLFQPQQHPAWDAHDTFFLKEPAQTLWVPEDYLQEVKKIHEEGGHGSIGYDYKWSREEAMKNILWTHTTAVSAQILYEIAKEPVFRPRKFFSIDWVFRNETLDATHLAEFH